MIAFQAFRDLLPNILPFLRQVIFAILQLPLGVVVGAATERFCRRTHPYDRLRNVLIKTAISYLLVSFILGLNPFSLKLFGIEIKAVASTFTDNEVGSCKAENAAGKCLTKESSHIGIIAFSVLRILLAFSGIVLGSALQPVGLTGGIATGKSTVSGLLSGSQSCQSKTSSNNEKCGNERRILEGTEKDAQFIVIDVDGIAHDILLPEKLGHDSVYHRLIAEFGNEILSTGEKESENDALNSQNSSSPLQSFPPIDRRKLGDVVFRDKQKRRKLNSITHPKIIKIMLKQIVYEGLNFNHFFSSKKQLRERPRVVCVDIPLLFEGGIPMRTLFGTIIVVACDSKLQLERLHKRNPDLSLEQCQQRIASQIPVEEKARRAHIVIRNDGNLGDLKDQVEKVKHKTISTITGSQRGVELSWLVMLFGGLLLLTRYYERVLGVLLEL